MKVILLLSGRGGQSKTCIAYATAHIADTLKLKVSLLDLDTNQSLFLRIQDRLMYEESAIIKEKIGYNYGHLNFSNKQIDDQAFIHNAVKEFAGDADVLIIDSYGHLSKIHRQLLPLVDTIVIPTIPERSAFRSASHAFALINESINDLLKENPDISEDEIPIILMARSRWVGKKTKEIDQDLSAGSLDHGYGVLTSYTTEYKAQYANADELGLPITELPKLMVGRDFDAADKAAYQMKLLSKEILRSTGFKI
jgi:cellulose biosynthesis protein BcsQ